jgi:NADH:ubiquinone oxidoreductase subunit F (NADH-binding)/NADH:ubiquinone oxidoreductase subunit E/NAD-dependent dihydropyrimidine dehydrogenase PreA subunit
MNEGEKNNNPATSDLAEVDRIIASIGNRQQDLIPILSAIQAHFNYLPEAALRRIPQLTDISAASVAGVSTFYAQFRHRPAGRHAVKVCIGTACHVKGAEGIYDAFRKHLGIAESDDTDSEKLFTIEKVACLGCCMLAPAVQIDDITYGFVEPGKVGSVLSDFLEAQRQTRLDADHAQMAAPALGEARICLCSSCIAGGSLKTHTALADAIRRLALPVTLKTVGCSGISYQTPLVELALADGSRFHYGLVQPEAVEAILLRHFRPAQAAARVKTAVNRLLEHLLEAGAARTPVTRYAIDLRSGPDACYSDHQQRLVTEHAGEMNPSDIDDYLAHDGFKALETCLKTLTPQAIIDTISASGLRGRGGAGFATGRKWQLVHDAAAPVRYLICNGDEGDPGAFMDRMILESFPFRVLEGMIIAARAIGASEGYLYIRNEYPLATQRMREAISQCEARGFLGARVHGTAFSLRLHVVEGAGAFVCGEESALIQAIEGKRGMPRFRPPYPAESGLWGNPTLVNNVETYGMIPWILRHGAEAFTRLGTAGSKGTKAFALAGKIARGGLIEVPMGMPLRQIVEEIGGGVPGGKAFKAVQVGGPSGGCVPARLADAPVDYEALAAAGAIMGSGGMVVLDQDDCMVAIAHYFLTFTQRESCGKCTYCRIGTKRMLEILDRLCTGTARKGDLAELEHLAQVTQEGSLCGLGRTAPNPVLSTLAHFREEYEAHLEGRCPALQCKALIRYRITDNCIGCTRCAQACGAGAIRSIPHAKHEIDDTLCTRCDACRQTCPVEGAVVVETGLATARIKDNDKRYD